MGGDLIQGGINGIGLCGQTFIAVDRSGTATNNNIYMVASVLPTGASNGTDVMFARSTDGGLTFSAPTGSMMIQSIITSGTIFGTLSVAPNGRIDVVWLDTRNAANNIDSQLFYSYSTDGGLTWAPNIAVSNSFNPQAGFPQNQKIGDYITIVSDATGGNVAYAATFNVNPNAVGGHEQDVYYVRVSPIGRRHAYADAYSFANTYGDIDSFTNSNSNSNAHDYSDSYCHGDSNTTATATATVTATSTPSPTSTATVHQRLHHTHSDCYRYVNIYANSYCHSQTHTDAKICADAESPSHAPAET